jgi:hypothetical protein
MSTLCRGVEQFFFCVKIMLSFHKHVLKKKYIIRVINLTELNKLALIQFDERK